MNAAFPSREPLDAHRSEKGMALILAILALLLMTFLGLTLTTTTSTELQIANNYRWSQQALYNAEAGLEAARTFIAAATPAGVLPVIRGGSWDPDNPGPPNPPLVPPPSAGAIRNFENTACDLRGNGQGYGVVLNGGGILMENVTSLFGAPLNGAVTIWVRRATEQLGYPGYQVRDDASNDVFLVTVEGIAPNLSASNRAARVIETVVGSTTNEPCGGGNNPAPQASQTGFHRNVCPTP